MTASTVTASGGMSSAPRPDVLAFPPATTARFLVLVAAMLAAGLFVGTAIFNIVAGPAWTAAIGECASASAAVSDDPVAQQAAFLRCSASAERGRAAFSLGAATFLALAGLVVLFVAPAVIHRRRRLRLPVPGMAGAVDRVRALAHELGLRRPPILLVGPSDQHDAFCFGRPGRYRIVLPPGLVIFPRRPDFDAVVRHELSHLVHHDVAWSWLANAVWYVLGPMLLLPVVLSLASADLSVLPDYLWRAAVLAFAVHFARRGLLRSREHDADLRAAQVGGPQAMISRLASLPRRPSPTPIRRWAANHPDAATRLDVVVNPGRAAVVTTADGFTVSFLAALVLPFLGNLIISAFLGSPVVALARVVVAALLAPFLGATLGLGLWRQAVVGHLTGVPARVAPVALGVFVGCVAGEMASFAGIALEGLERFGQPLLVSLVALAFAGATVVVAGLGELWAQASGRFRGASGNWVPAVVFSTLLFGVALWAGDQLRAVLSAGGWGFASAVVQSWMANPVLCLLAVLFAAVTGWAQWAARRGTTTPSWLAAPRPWLPTGPRTRHVIGVGVVAGLAGVAVLAGFRYLTAPPAGFAEQEQWLHAYVWLAGAVAATAALLVGLLFGARGRGTALLAGPVAAVIVGAGVLVINTARGGALTFTFAMSFLPDMLAAGFLLSVATAWLGLVAPVAPRRSPSWLVLITVSAFIAAGVATGVIAGRDALMPSGDGAVPVVDDQAWVVEEAVHDYKTRRAPEILLRRHKIDTMMRGIESDRSLDRAARADRMRSAVIEPMRELQRDAESYKPPNDEVRDVHRRCLAGLRFRIAGYEGFALAWEKNDESLIQPALDTLVTSVAEWDAWAKGVLAL